MQNEQVGKLYIVATPIGNLQDITLRAIEILKTVDKIAAEDTRHSTPLLKHYSINKPTVSLHDFNEQNRVKTLIDELLGGYSIALISDAGTPLISDPGYHLVHEARRHGIEVVPIPGACAGIAALSAAGLPSDRFVFEGFLSAKTEARQKKLLALVPESRTIIFYEAPHRLLAALVAMAEVFGSTRQAVVARELTKLYETIRSASLGELISYFETHADEQRGEIVILVKGAEEEAGATKTVVPEQVLKLLLAELPLKQAVMLASKITGERKNTLYDLALTLDASKGEERQ